MPLLYGFSTGKKCVSREVIAILGTKVENNSAFDHNKVFCVEREEKRK